MQKKVYLKKEVQASLMVGCKIVKSKKLKTKFLAGENLYKSGNARQ